MTYIKIRVKFKKEEIKKETKKGAKKGAKNALLLLPVGRAPSQEIKGTEEWFERLLEIRHDLILGFCRDPKQINISGYGTCLLADGESIEDIIKRQEDAEKAEELARFDFSAEAMREGVRRATKDSNDAI